MNMASTDMPLNSLKSRFGLPPDVALYAMPLPAEKLSKVELVLIKKSLGRECARHALTNLGFDGQIKIKRGAMGQPIWPKHVCGSITHTDSYSICAVSWQKYYSSLGIDSEDWQRVKPYLAPRILEKNGSLSGMYAEQQELAIIFSAKEALYKSLCALTGVFFGLRDAQIELLDHQRFSWRLLVDLSSAYPKHTQGLGHYDLAKSHVYTSVLTGNV